MLEDHLDKTSLETIFKRLEEETVRYVVVGGLAVVAHGYLCFTADVDIFLDLEPGNLKKAVSVFSNLGYQPRVPVALHDFISYKARASWIKEKNLRVFSLWNPKEPATKVDLFVEAPMDFDEAEKNSLLFDAGSGIKIRVIGLEDLIRMKLAAGRRRDIDDVENLRKLGAARDET
jgi:predicted nucleotidyltransferase